MRETLRVGSSLLNKLFFKLAVLIFSFLWVSYAAADIIDFETVPGGTPSDGLAIHDQYRDNFGVIFGLDTSGDYWPDEGQYPHLEKAGRDGSDGFLNSHGNSENPYGCWDCGRTGYESRLGNYFLRFGTGQLQSKPVPRLIIEYDSPVSGASGEIWDIDAWYEERIEQWKISALDSSHNVIDSIVSPQGIHAEDDSSLDGMPWTWSFNHETADIYAISIEYIGTGENNIGLAFDNFSPSSPVPLPSSLLLLGSGLSVTGILIRKKKKCSLN